MLTPAKSFWGFALISIGAALGVVFHKSVIYSALFLIAVFFSIAGFFVLNNADFLAVAQVIVYGVGLTIIILFGIMFTGDRLFPTSEKFVQKKLPYAIVSLMLLGVLAPAVMSAFNTVKMPAILELTLRQEGTTKLLGQSLFTQYALPFELASVLLLLAMIGAIIISKKSFQEDPLIDRLKYDTTSKKTDFPSKTKGIDALSQSSTKSSEKTPAGVA